LTQRHLVSESSVPHISGQRVSIVVALALAVSGCASAFENMTTSHVRWKNPFETETNALTGPTRVSRPVTAEDLVGPDGSCAFAAPASSEAQAQPAPAAAAPAAAPEAPPPPPGRAVSGERSSSQALYFTAGPPAGGGSAARAAPPEVRQGARGIGLEMSECDVVRFAGPPANVQISANERGERTVTLTYLSGERPGIYNFVSGRLKTMERVAEPQAPAKANRKSKSAKAKQ
jgi:hypothetical protein